MTHNGERCLPHRLYGCASCAIDRRLGSPDLAGEPISRRPAYQRCHAGLRVLRNSAVVSFLFVVSSERRPQGRKLPEGLQKPFLASCIAAAAQRTPSRVNSSASHYCDATHCAHHDVCAGSERRSSAGKPSLLTVRISSSLKMLFETPGASRSSRWARPRISFSAFARRTEAWMSAKLYRLFAAECFPRALRHSGYGP
jgi:hypothetical protein